MRRLRSALMFFVPLKEKDDGSPGDLLIKQARSEQATIQATDHYAQRVSIDDKLSLLITGASLKDQKTFTCMVVSENNLMEYPVSVLVHSKTASPWDRDLKLLSYTASYRVQPG